MSTNDNGRPLGSIAAAERSGRHRNVDAEFDLPAEPRAGGGPGPPPSGLSRRRRPALQAVVRPGSAPPALIAGILTSALAVAAVYYIAPPKYPVSVLIKVSSSKGNQGPGGSTQEDIEFSMRKSFQMELVKSRDVINRALEMQVKDLVKNNKGTPVDSRFVKELPLVREQGDPVDWLQGIKAEPHLKSQEIIVVSGATRDRPEDMTIVMNALGKALGQQNMSSEEQQHHKLIEQAQAKPAEGSARLDQKRKLLQLRQKNGDDELAKKTLERLEVQPATTAGRSACCGSKRSASRARSRA